MQHDSDAPNIGETETQGDVDGLETEVAITSSTTLVEVVPGTAVVFGDVPDGLEVMDFGLVPAVDRHELATALGGLGNLATVGGNLANVAASAQGLYRVTSATQALLNKGATLAVKDGANLGAVFSNGKLVAQARFVPVSTVTAAGALAAVGPAVAMIAIQMQLNYISGLISTNIALTSQVLLTIRREQWSELTGLVDETDSVVSLAREAGAVTGTLWDKISGKGADLRAQRELYRRNVGAHIKQIDRLDVRRRREYLDANAEAIAFDAYALLSAFKAWTSYQALHAGRARAIGPDDANEALLVNAIVRETRTEVEAAVPEATRLISELARELRVIAELPGRSTVPLTKKRKDTKAAQLTAAQLLAAVAPLADSLRPPASPLDIPRVVAGPKALDPAAQLRVLRWILEDGEALVGLGFPFDLHEGDVVKGIGQNLLERLDLEKPAVFVAVTDRRVLTARANTFRQEGKIEHSVPLEHVRYVRSRGPQRDGGRSTVELTTRDVDFRWAFHEDSEQGGVDSFAGLLAASMTLPEAEREELVAKVIRGPESVGVAAALGELERTDVTEMA
ncbi:hypothetical protein [Cellulosimicrobium sp. KWT-B]|uniref:hypothetical protein n=1 Tax=Cellulosimicrobium sp. KWT-B TaxID=1981152 RepID=UPI000A327075|nr:hypothetical protein [Cellulosimicrobium sp. KWT-B]